MNNPVFQYLPHDIPLPLPTGGMDSVMVPIFHILLVVSFLVHIIFINILIGSSVLSVINNWIGHLKGDKNYDKVAYLLTTPVTISENMGALWGVAPLLIVSVMYTAFFYSASVMNSPQWLHIIWGNIVAFLISYLYKFSWHKLENHKALHITIGAIAAILFLSLPPVFMSTVQLYVTPSTWTPNTHFWNVVTRPDVLFRLAHFYLGAFAVNGMFMLLYGVYKRNKGQDLEAAKILIRQGKAWFLVPTVLNLFVGTLTFFQFPHSGIENFYSKGFDIFIILAVIAILVSMAIMLKYFLDDNIPTKAAYATAGFLVITLIFMGITRHGMRISLLEPAIAQMKKQTQEYISEVEKDYKEAVTKPVGISVAEAANLSEGEKLIAKNGCSACHSLDQKIVGPPFKEIAKKGYTPDRIVQLIYNPEPSNWPGYPPMTPMSNVPKEEAEKIAKWITELK
jgi:cytochrome c